MNFLVALACFVVATHADLARKRTRIRAAILRKRTSAPNVAALQTGDTISCFDFNGYPAGTVIDQVNNPTFEFAKGNVELALNTEAENFGATLQVIHPSVNKTVPPIVYASRDVSNGCTMESPAGFGVIPPQGKGRGTLSDKLKSINFKFTSKYKEVGSYFIINLADFGDLNEVDEAKNVKLILQGFDSNGDLIPGANLEKDINPFPSWQYDACNNDFILRIDAAPPASIAEVRVAFSYDLERPDGTMEQQDYAADWNFGISRVCFPGANKISPPKPSVKNDPHFTGFDGSKYDFQGEPGSIFNVITDKNVQVNAKFVSSPIDHKTYMGVIGVRLGNNTLVVSPAGVEMNGKKITVGTHPFGSSGYVSVESDKVDVMGYGFSFSILTAMTARVAHLDLTVSSTDFVNPHGLLGQTAQFIVKGQQPKKVKVPHHNFNAVGFIDGKGEDYLVSDGLLGTDFVFNRFDEVQTEHGFHGFRARQGHPMVIGSAAYLGKPKPNRD